MDSSKPFKLVSKDRRVKKGIAARDLEDLVQKAKRHFEINQGEKIRLVLEEDGTEIAEDAYLMLQEDNIQIMILKPCEEWTPKPFTVDVTDHSRSINTEHNLLNPVSTLKGLAKDPSSILLLNEKELEILTQFDTSQDIGISNSTLEFLIEKCEEQLEEKRKVRDALSMVHLFKKAKEQQGESF